MSEHDACGCGCGCENEQEPEQDACACGNERVEPTKRVWLQWLRLGVAAACLIAMFFLPEEHIASLVLGLAACLIAGYQRLWRALKTLLHFRIDEGIMMAVACAACFALRDFREAAAIALFFALGQQLEGMAGGKSRKSIAALSNIRPDTALLRQPDGSLREIPAEAVAVGDELVVLPHTRIPVDGVVTAGASGVDTSALTGESVPREASPGDTLLSGCMNGNGQLTLRATAPAGESAAARLLELVEHAAKQKTPGERFLTRFARIYMPIVMLAGALLAVVPSLITGGWDVWVPRGLLFLVSACPCAIVLSVPLSFFAGIGGAARRGVLIKGGQFIETLAHVDTFVFDKTGTLTTDKFQVAEIIPCDDIAKEELLCCAAAAEHFSAHPLAKAIVAAGPEIDERALGHVEEQPGGGVRANFEGDEIICGSRRMLEASGIDTRALPGAQVYVAKNRQLLGALRLESALHPDAPKAVAQLKNLGIKHFVLLSGDEEAAAAHAAAACGIEEVYAQLLPEDKLRHMERLKLGGKAAYVGDGVNDAPVLALADVGVAMGFGTQAASEAADMVLAGQSLLPLVYARQLASRTRRTVLANVIFALAVKILVVAIGMFLLSPPIWLAVFADVGVMVITVANAGRLIRR